ncbi:MAG: HIT family protein [bacterium]
MSHKDCIFCQINSEASQASYIHRDEFCIAFLTIEPINPDHTLIIPNQHAKNHTEMSIVMGCIKIFFV